MRRSTIRGTAALLLACTACHTYTAIDPSASPAGTDVRVTLTESGGLALGNQFGAVAREVDGRLESASDSAVTVAVTQVTRTSGVEDPWRGEHVTIPRTDIASVQRPTTNVGRSVVLAIALLGGVYLIGNAVGGVQATGSSNGTPPPGGKQ